MCIRDSCVWAMSPDSNKWFDLIWLAKICAKNYFYNFIPSGLDLWPLDLKFAHLVTVVVMRSFYGFPISRKSEAGDRRTDGRGATLNAAPLWRKGRIICDAWHHFVPDHSCTSPMQTILDLQTLRIGNKLLGLLALMCPGPRQRS